GFAASWTGNVTVPGDDDDATGDDDDATGDDDDSATGDDDDSATGDDDDSATGDDDDSAGSTPQCEPLTTLTAASGSFDDGSGPGVDYENSLLCGWLIDVDATQFASVTLSFSDFDLENSFDTLEVFDGPNNSASSLASLTGSSLPSDITSSSTQLYVEFITDISVTYEGFDASWVANPIPVAPTCSGTTNLSGATGAFEDGSGPGVDYDNNLNCGWLIDVGTGTYADITLSFSAFDVEATFDEVNVYDGADANASLLGSFDGTSLPAPITSTGTQLFVEFVTDSSVTYEGWNASWTANLPPPTCSGTTNLSGATGTFEDGSGPGVDYSDNLNCGWLIDVSPSTYQDITLSFSAFDVESTFDEVNVYDGADATASLLGSFDGTSLPAPITSSGTQLFVEFVTDGSVNYEGWEAAWTANLPPATCSGTTTLSGASGTFEDGSGPGVDYSDNLNCGWLIDVGTGTYQDITLSWSAFDVEGTFDEVNVYDGADANASLLGSYDGTSLPPSITSTGTQLFVEFVTDSSVNYEGWTASWTANLLPPLGCSGTTVLTAAVGSFSDGSGTGDYLANSTCGWLIDVPGSEAVTLSFDSFFTELNFDYVTIYEGANSSAPVLAQYSGATVPTGEVLIASFDDIFVEFTSDGSVQYPGFEASYETWGTTDECFGNVVLTDQVGAISDGGGNYSNNALCSWTIDVPEAAGIEINFDFLQTESNFDYLDVFDGADDFAAILGSYDGTISPAPLLTTNMPQAHVLLDTDSSVTAPGFTAIYSAVYASCSGPVTAEALSGGFGDGLGPDANYVNNQTCSWLIDAPASSTIEVTAVYWDLESGFDYVDLYDGGSSSAPFLTDWNGTGTNDVWLTTGNQAYVEFTSDSSVTDGGFWIEYTVIP
ncbi:MAG: hypothetical protein KDA24_15720, partial [Deltaproteobacteria bacterium]|nr:hypothetical protein [Deltaproteobacteria bacterium]